MATITMREALGNGRVTFSSSWIGDAFFYLCNNHVLLSVLLSHPEHPYGKIQRGLVLFNSLCFAYFITGLLNALVLNEMARGVLMMTMGTALQLLFDVPSSMLGTCPCAHPSLPGFVQGTCRGVALACLSCHTCASCIFGVLGGVVLLAGHLFNAVDPQVVWDQFLITKLNAFVGAVPWALLIFAVFRQCERGDMVTVRRTVDAPRGMV